MLAASYSSCANECRCKDHNKVWLRSDVIYRNVNELNVVESKLLEMITTMTGTSQVGIRLQVEGTFIR